MPLNLFGEIVLKLIECNPLTQIFEIFITVAIGSIRSHDFGIHYCDHSWLVMERKFLHSICSIRNIYNHIVFDKVFERTFVTWNKYSLTI